MNWFADQRQQWIAETVRIFGFIQREHICRKFGVSVPQASLDLQQFQTKHPKAIRYDTSAKRYVSLAKGMHAFYVDCICYETKKKWLTGGEIKAIARAAPQYQLFMERKGQPDKGVGDGEAVDISGGHFWAVPPATHVRNVSF